MNIALITDGITPYVTGGMQRHSFYLVKCFVRQGHRVTLYHMNKSAYDIEKLEQFTPEEKKNITGVVIGFPSLPGLPGHYIRESYRYSEKIYEHIQENISAFDFIYTKGFSGWKLLEEKKKGLKCPPVGVNFHGYEMFQVQPDLRAFIQSRFFLRKPVEWISRNADFVFSYGGKITGIIEKILGSDDKIIEVPAGIEKEWLREGEPEQQGKVKFLFVGRYERRKGILELNSVLEEMKAQNNFEFGFIGPVPVEKQVKDDKVMYHGPVSDNGEMRKFLQQYDVLVCPSWSEGMPNVILEAMAGGLAIIASDVGAVSIMVDEANGLLIKPGSRKEIKRSMQAILSMDPGSLLLMRKKSIGKIRENFLWEKVSDILVQKMNKALSRG